MYSGFTIVQQYFLGSPLFSNVFWVHKWSAIYSGFTIVQQCILGSPLFSNVFWVLHWSAMYCIATIDLQYFPKPLLVKDISRFNWLEIFLGATFEQEYFQGHN
jgi:hypothetical protein